jgi:sodium transport system ATP-binding protein
MGIAPPYSPAGAAIAADRLCKTFQAGRGKSIEAVRAATFQVMGGEVFGMLGPNGAGKTTLLRMLAGIIAPTSGHCHIMGIDTQASPESVRRRLGFLSGNTKLYGRLTARETLRYFGRLYDIDEATIERRSRELSDRFDMGSFMDRRVETLSTGQTQKVSISRVLMHDPPVLILDEPTLGLDVMTSRAILNFITEARQNGSAILFSTHYMTEADQLCDRVAFIHEGELLAVGSQDEHHQRTGTTNMRDAFLAMVEGGAGDAA